MIRLNKKKNQKYVDMIRLNKKKNNQKYVDMIR